MKRLHRPVKLIGSNASYLRVTQSVAINNIVIRIYYTIRCKSRVFLIFLDFKLLIVKKI